MRGITDKLLITGSLGILVIGSSVSYAGTNPFKKSKDYNFDSNVAWYESNDAALKSGSVPDGSDTNYYHLNIDKYRLMLRMGKNDPSGELENTRLLAGLAIAEVKADGNRLPVFDGCLQNQQNPGKKLKQNALVANDVCINAGGGGDFVINLDDQTRNILKKAKTLVFVVEPYGRPVKLTFSMSGYAAIMANINKPVPPPVVKKPEPEPEPVIVKAKPKSVIARPKPAAAKVRPKPKSEPVKTCYARAPANFKQAIPAMAYPCNDAAKKSTAKTKISARVEQEKKKVAALKASKQKQRSKQEEAADDKREADWDKKQKDLWISRCERHWEKGRSPCFCEKYLSQAPAGVKNTCIN